MGTITHYVRLDDHGVWRVADTRVMLDSVLAGFHQGQSPESIRQSYPALSLEQVYGAIADYLANQAEFDDYLRQQDEVWAIERARARSTHRVRPWNGCARFGADRPLPSREQAAFSG